MLRRWFFIPTVLALMTAVFLTATAQSQRAKQKNPQRKKAKAKVTDRKQTSKKRKQNQKKAKKKTRRIPADPEPPSAEAAGVPVLSTGDSYDDFASVAETSDGTLFAAYAAYYDGHDQIRLHRRLPNGRWSTHSYVPLVEAAADIWMPQLAVDANDNLWVIWSEQTGRSQGKTGNFDVYARALIKTQWGPLVRLSNDPKSDINLHVATDKDRNIHIVWQAHPGNFGVVRYRRFDGENWSNTVSVTTDQGSDWYPRVAVDNQGVAWIAFDSYRNGDYDVFLTSVTNGRTGRLIPIATTKYYEAHASVACTPDGNVWVTWEQGGYRWGKDQGYWLRTSNRNIGSTLGSARTIAVAAYAGGKLLAGPALPGGPQRARAMPGLAVGKDGRLWLRYRHQKRGGMRRPGRFTRYWTENVTHLTGAGWAEPIELAASNGRISAFSRALPTSDGALVVAYSGDRRTAPNYHMPNRDHVLIATVSRPDAEGGTPDLADYTPPADPENAKPWDDERERREITAIRSHFVTIDGKPHRIVRGDLHRHTELSWDVGPGNDGSYLDFYRYMIDVAAMDFGGLTDHQGGGHYAYWWWLSEKSCDMYYLAPRYVPLYGYERSARFPNGHRNVFHSYRGVPIFPFQLTLNQTGRFPGVATGNLVDNDTKLLYKYLHKTGGIAISHTSGTPSMGTDWRDNDPKIEPVVEIYQGARNSYEALGAPRVHPEDQPPQRAPGGFQKAGMVWNAYQKGYRLGTISSSDHGSTHISYAAVYTTKNDRVEIIDAIRKRHTFGATANIIVDFRANGHFMGDEFRTSDRPALELKVQGAGKIARIDLVRNNEYVYTTEPDAETKEVRYTDMQPKRGVNLYYFRILQADGEVAWASPVWINHQPK